MSDMWDRLRRKRPVEGPFKGIVIIDDLPTGDNRVSPEEQERMVEWFREKVASGQASIGTIKIPDGEDPFKVLLDRADEET